MTEQNTPIGGPKPTAVINPTLGKVTPRIIQASELSAAERMLLEKQFGYDGTSPVPSDLGAKLTATTYSPEELKRQQEALLAAAASAANEMPPNSIAKPTGLDFERIPTQQANVTDAQLQQLYAAKTTSAPSQPVSLPFKAAQQPAPNQFEQLRAAGVEAIQSQKEMGDLHPDIAKAYQMTQQDTPASAAPQQSPAPQPSVEQPQPSTAPAAPVAPAKSREELLQQRRDLRETLLKQIDPDDLQRYKYAAITGGLYSKTYSAMDGAVLVTFCDVTGQDEDELVRQQTIDRYKRRYMQTDDDVAEKEANFRMAVAACLHRIAVAPPSGDDYQLRLDVPDTVSVSDYVSRMDRSRLCPVDLHDDDTNLYAWTSFLMRQLLPTGSLRQHVFNSFRRFQSHLNLLQAIMQDPESF